MKPRKYTQGITIFTTPQMYQDVKEASDALEISLSEFFRSIIKEHFENLQKDHDEGRVIK
jgi:CO dehydrogenase/acetyl-CoA synthase epsilon subunit